MCFEALSWPVLYDRIYRHHSLACRSRPAALLVVEDLYNEMVFGVTPTFSGLDSLVGNPGDRNVRRLSELQSLVGLSWVDDKQNTPCIGVWLGCPPGSRVRQASRGSSHDKHPFPDSGNAWGSHAGGNYWNA